MNISSTAKRYQAPPSRDFGSKPSPQQTHDEPKDTMIWSDWSPQSKERLADAVSFTGAAAVAFGTAALLSSGGLSLLEVMLSTVSGGVAAAVAIPMMHEVMGVADTAKESSRVVPRQV